MSLLLYPLASPMPVNALRFEAGGKKTGNIPKMKLCV
jgi:hypothetical protein